MLSLLFFIFFLFKENIILNFSTIINQKNTKIYKNIQKKKQTLLSKILFQL